MTFSKSITRISDKILPRCSSALEIRNYSLFIPPGRDFNMIARRETFDKSERLCSTKLISGLFENGNVFYTSLFKVVWNKSQVTLSQPVQVAFSVSKRAFRLAVTRNVIKRRMREAWRKNKFLLYEYLDSQKIQIVLIIIVKGKSIPDYLTIEKSMKDIISKLRMNIREGSEVRSRKSEEGIINGETGRLHN
jgi:ribonuclease P protein component